MTLSKCKVIRLGNREAWRFEIEGEFSPQISCREGQLEEAVRLSLVEIERCMLANGNER